MKLASKRLLISSGATLLVLLALNLWLWPNQTLQESPTSFGIMRDGYQAAFDLLSELHFPVTRSYRRPRLIPLKQTVWFVSPSFLEGDKPSAHDSAHEVVEWVARGATAVIFGDSTSDWTVLGLAHEVEKSTNPDRAQSEGDNNRQLIKGAVLRQPRWLEIPELLHFTATQDQKSKPKSSSRERIALTADGKPFALEMAVGKNGGRIIAIADDSFFRNERLADADASLVLLDLVRAFGTPAFDEHSHGLAPPASLTLAILDSRALLPLLLGLMAATLWVRSQRVWPRRSVDPEVMPAPSIASFVESLSILYSRAGDPAAAFRAYRAGFLRRLRRQIGLRADYPEDLLLERLARDRSLTEATRHWLLGSDAPTDQRHLEIAVRAIESYPRSGR